jgi:hypothetical protein
MEVTDSKQFLINIRNLKGKIESLEDLKSKDFINIMNAYSCMLLAEKYARLYLLEEHKETVSSPVNCKLAKDISYEFLVDNIIYELIEEMKRLEGTNNSLLKECKINLMNSILHLEEETGKLLIYFDEVIS